MEVVAAVIALTAMEIVLGIDNIVFITAVAARLPEKQRAKARQLGLIVAMASRLLLLFALSWILGMDKPIFEFAQLASSVDWLAEWFREHSAVNEVSIRDLILLGGGLYLIRESVVEIHGKVEGNGHAHEAKVAPPNFTSVLVRITIMDLVFSLDSVITAVGMVEKEHFYYMVLAIVISVGVMLVFANSVGVFVEKNPTVKMLALSFLLLIGVMLVAEGAGTHFSKGYIYFAMGFALVVELLNMRMRAKKRAGERAAAEA